MNTSRRVYNYLKRNKVQKLEFVIMTHPHIDHIGGLLEILNDSKISVGKVYKTKMPIYNHYKNEDDLFRLEEYDAVNALRNDFTFGRKMTEKNYQNRQINKFSIVCRIIYGKNSFLMTGDSQHENDVDMVKKNLYLKSQVLKVPHHGFSDIRDQDMKRKKVQTDHKYLFDRVEPDIAIISDGYKSTYKIPGKYVMLELHKANVYTTSVNGNIVVTSNGKK